MRFRRHVPQRRPLLDRLKGLLPRRHPAPSPTDEAYDPPPTASATAPPPPASPPPPRQDVDDAVTVLESRGKLAVVRAFARRHPKATAAIATFAGTFTVGYVIAAVFLFPAPIFAATKSVPRLIGLARSEAENRLANTGLLVGDIHGVTHPTAARGQVVWQDPPTGVGVPEGTLVELTVSNGPQRTPVPDLLGYDAHIARELLEAAGLQVGRVDSTQAPVPQGVVVSTRPSTGSTILPGSEVTLVVSVGAPTITVPDLSGLTREEAEIVLQQVGLTLGTTGRRASGSVPPGTIMAQNPRPGTLSAPGTAVDIFLARAPSR